ncbi:membrane protein BRI3-like [Ruditapes philippinarum]|uniref:membrane protein BRI3-like n=1 Tax=Ruditapes philippinarum TaxID=129788 RepID=UPI00295B07E6|nr:membrane protein BRI3-like [Ruditapes philippinarum]XP_060552480.1 membrane protein BRI3-like [Ruditapes philippinarum]XP_060552481.1 membrane protein BRI3-like [Ruditapes philippinarum]
MSKIDGPPPPYQQQGYPPQPGFAPQQGYAPPPQQGYAPPPQQGYAPPPQQGYGPPPQHHQSSNVVVVTQPQQQVVAVGGCRACGVGHVSDSFTALGIILAICFFPLGVLCCFLLMEKRCDRCGASY